MTANNMLYRSGWNASQYWQFLNTTLGTLASEYGDIIRGKNVILLHDGAPEHGPAKDGTSKVGNLPNCAILSNALRKEEDEFQPLIKLFKIPSNSPQLNLCEFYNRCLRFKVNKLKRRPDIVEQLAHGYKHGTKVRGRLNLLEMLICSSIDQLKKEPFTRQIEKWRAHITTVIANQGYLDYSTPL